jgi:hypothetical protein
MLSPKKSIKRIPKEINPKGIRYPVEGYTGKLKFKKLGRFI